MKFSDFHKELGKFKLSIVNNIFKTEFYSKNLKIVREIAEAGHCSNAVANPRNRYKSTK
jgi:hypothetical protein